MISIIEQPVLLQALTSPEQLVKDVNARSLYASPFPYNVTLEDLTAFFEKYGKVGCFTVFSILFICCLIPVAMRCPLLLNAGQFL